MSYNYNRSETDFKALLISMQHGSENYQFDVTFRYTFDLRVKMLIELSHFYAKLKFYIGE